MPSCVWRGRRCAVFGRAVGAGIPVDRRTEGEAAGVAAEGAEKAAAAARSITLAELASHNTAASCWVSIDGQVYDFSDFLEEHPAGAQSILDYGGQDGTVVFDTIHSRSMLDDFEPIGPYIRTPSVPVVSRVCYGLLRSQRARHRRVPRHRNTTVLELPWLASLPQGLVGASPSSNLSESHPGRRCAERRDGVETPSRA